MRILFAASEATPFIKSGGLADVAGSLPKYLNNNGVKTDLILPLYAEIASEYRDLLQDVAVFTTNLSWRKQYVGLKKIEMEGIEYFFIDNEYYFKRSGLYGYYDDGERFAYFSKAVLESINHLTEKPDLIHCNDWHTAAIPVFNRAYYDYLNLKTVFTIHNLKYQGIFPEVFLGDVLGLERKSYYQPEVMEYRGNINLLKGALLFSDRITTVSSSYAEEILYSYFGEGLAGFLNKHKYKLSGILNGIDYNEYNPKTDEKLYVKYDTEDIEKKKINKTLLQREMGFSQREDTPLLAVVSRFTEQKGLDILNYILPELLEKNLQIVILGYGEKKYEDAFRYFSDKYPEKFKANIFFDENLARRIYAGCDIFLMPSKFEPCGLSQMIAMRYGAVPIVRETGGLKDTVEAFNPLQETGTGFTFYGYNAHDFLGAINRCLSVFWQEKETWKKLIKENMLRDNGWQKSTEKYIELYEKILFS